MFIGCMQCEYEYEQIQTTQKEEEYVWRAKARKIFGNKHKI